MEDKPRKECNLLGAGLAGPSSASSSPQPGAGEEAPSAGVADDLRAVGASESRGWKLTTSELFLLLAWLQRDDSLSPWEMKCVQARAQMRMG